MDPTTTFPDTLAVLFDSKPPPPQLLVFLESEPDDIDLTQCPHNIPLGSDSVHTISLDPGEDAPFLHYF